MNSPDFTHQRCVDSSDIEFTKSKLVQGLRTVTKEVLNANGAVITNNELKSTVKPLNIVVPANQTLFAFKLSRDSRKRVFCIMFDNLTSGEIDRDKQAKIWQVD